MRRARAIRHDTTHMRSPLLSGLWPDISHLPVRGPSVEQTTPHQRRTHGARAVQCWGGEVQMCSNNNYTPISTVTSKRTPGNSRFATRITLATGYSRDKAAHDFIGVSACGTAEHPDSGTCSATRATQCSPSIASPVRLRLVHSKPSRLHYASRHHLCREVLIIRAGIRPGERSSESAAPLPMANVQAWTR